MSGDQPPHDPASEMACLGAMLLNRGIIADVIEVIKAEDYYRPNNGLIHQVITDLYTAGEAPDSVTVASELGKRGALTRIGGASYLHDLTTAVPVASNAAAYAKIVAFKARQRRLIEAGDRFRQLGYTDATSAEEVDELLAQAGQFFSDVEQPSSVGMNFGDLTRKWRDWQRNTGDFVATPWDELNRWLPGGGLHRGTLTVIGGRPGDGKSAAGLNVILAAAEAGIKSAIFSVEMDDVEVFSRLIAAGSWSPFSQIVGKRMERDTWERVEEYLASNATMDLTVVDQAYQTVEDVVTYCRVNRPSCIFVDYLQLMSATNKKSDYREVVSHITRSLKIAAKHFNMAVIAAAQLNRDPAKGNRLPTLADLAESDSIGRDADLVLLLHRPNGDEGIIKLVCDKNRNGRTGVINLVFRGGMARVG